jgi:Sec-independent protein translocase protein TatA
VIAIFPTLGWQEMFLLLVLGLLLYGRNLPDAGRSLGRVIAQLKRSFQDFKSQMDRDGEIANVKQAIQETAREVKNVAKVPRALSNPKNALRELTHEAMSSPIDASEDKGDTEPADHESPTDDLVGDELKADQQPSSIAKEQED